MKISVVSVVAIANVLGLASSTHAQTMPDNYLGLGVRPGGITNDSTSFVVDSKVKIGTIGDFTLSTRPSILFDGRIIESRLPITVEVPLGNSLYPYLGTGLAYNTDATNVIDPMLTGGVDIRLSNSLYVDVNLNLIFQNTINDLDVDLILTLNYKF